MKITVFLPEDNLIPEQRKQLSFLGEIIYAKEPLSKPVEEWEKIADGSEIIAIDPDNFGGFETARERLTQLMDLLPNLKGIALDTTSFGWIDLDYCKKRGITVTNCPRWSRNSVAELTVAMLLNLSKHILLLDRRTQRGKYEPLQGFELTGKTLGIIGLGDIGQRTAELAQGLGMKVIAFNRSPRNQEGVEMKKTMEDLFKEADAIAIHVTHSDENRKMFGKKELAQMKDGVFIFNATDRELVDEEAMAEALKSGKVGSYSFEGDDLEHGPLANIETAIGIKGFAWNTKEAWKNLMQIWTDSIVSLTTNTPINRIV